MRNCSTHTALNNVHVCFGSKVRAFSWTRHQDHDFLGSGIFHAEMSFLCGKYWVLLTNSTVNNAMRCFLSCVKVLSKLVENFWNY